VAAHVGRRRLLDPGHLAPDGLPVLVEAPEQERQPGEAALHEADLECRDALEHALGHQAEDLALGDDLGVAEVVLEVGVREAARGRRAGRPAPGVQADHEVVPGGRLVYPVEALVAPRRLVAHREQHLHEALVAAEPVDLLDGGVGVERRDQERCPQAVVAIEPLGLQPVVDRARERGLVVDVAADVEARDAVEDGPAHAGGVEQLGGERLGIAGRRRPPRPADRRR
jgi:hypothetical protein